MSLRRSACKVRYSFVWLITGLSLIVACGKTTVAQTPQQFFLYKNYFVTGDYTVGGWVEQSSANGFATGTISIPDCTQAAAMKQPCPAPPIPVGADIVAAYLYWGTVEGSQSSFVGQQAVFNGYKVIGTVLGNPNAPTSWSSGGCSGSSVGSKTMRFYRADVKPYLPLDLNASSVTYGSTLTSYGTGATPAIPVALADSGSNGNTQPNALGATLVLIWRVLNPHLPLNAVVLYDGSYAPSNQVPTFSESIFGFYEPAVNPLAKITHIVANGQANKGETVNFTSNNLGMTTLNSLYTATLGANAPPFPGIYGAWDNPTWTVSDPARPSNLNFVQGGSASSVFDTYETTSVTPSSTNSGCVNWGAIVFSTTVQDSDNDGLLDAWEQNQGYTDLASTDKATLSAPWVALPYPASELDRVHTPDIFVEGDYLTKLDGSLTAHSHLPKQAALDAVGQAFANRVIDLHVDLGPGIYTNDPYVVQYPISSPPNSDPLNPPGITTVSPPPSAGGKAIPESALLCTDPAQPVPPGSLCAFPNQSTIRWKGGFSFVQNSSSLGNFQAGRAKSYRYALFGHALGDARSSWSAVGKPLAGSQVNATPSVFGILTTPQLQSIVVSSNVATVTIETPTWIAPPNNATNPPTPAITSQIQPLILKPGDCSNPLYSSNPACADGNADRVTISGSLTPAASPAPGSFTPGINPATLTYPLNGTYAFSNVVSSAPDANGVVTTTFNITTANVPDGTYDFTNEPELGVSYLGPTSSSGEGDFDGGGDLAVTLGLWGADNAANCQPDPSQPISGTQVYCDNQVGTVKVQTGTMMHELGHTLTLTHGGTYYQDPVNQSLATYDVNCKPNFLSVMSYLFQVRGFVDGGFDYSAQTLQALNELSPPAGTLSENTGLGVDVQTGKTAQHETRWFSGPNSADNALGDFAKGHCDGTPLTTYATQPPPGLAPAEKPAVRVDGTAPASNFSTPLDWDNDTVAGNDPVPAPGEDLNYNGKIGDQPFLGLKEWGKMVDLRQTDARTDGFGFSGGGGITFVPGGGGITFVPGGGGITFVPGGGGITFVPGGGGITFVPGGGGVPEDDTVTANATVDPPSGLKCTTQLTFNGVTYPACTAVSGSTYLEKSKGVPLTWTSPDFGQIRSYTVWRAVGSFPTTQLALQSIGQFTKLTPTLTGTPPSTSFVDTTVKASTTYTYFVTDSNFFQAKSTASTPIVVTVKF